MLLSGTSMATAVTSGSIALMLEANRAANQYHPTLTPNAVEGGPAVHGGRRPRRPRRRVQRAQKGRRRLNTKGAIDLGKSIDTSTASGQFWLTSTPSPWTTIGGETHTWNQAHHLGQRDHLGQHGRFNETAWGIGDHLGQFDDVGQRHHLGQQRRLDRLGVVVAGDHLGQRLHRAGQRRGHRLGQRRRSGCGVDGVEEPEREQYRRGRAVIERQVGQGSGRTRLPSGPGLRPDSIVSL